MAKSLTTINIELLHYQCCLSTLAVNYIKKELLGLSNIDCEYNKLEYGVLLLESLKCSDAILDLETLTQSEIEEELEKLSKLCNCVACNEPTDLYNDTLPSSLESLL